jgi:hypothetical protein
LPERAVRLHTGIQRGTLRALAMTNATRAPEMPTVGETLAGFEVTTRSGIGAPAGFIEPGSPIRPSRRGWPMSALRRSS